MWTQNHFYPKTNCTGILGMEIEQGFLSLVSDLLITENLWESFIKERLPLWALLLKFQYCEMFLFFPSLQTMGFSFQLPALTALPQPKWATQKRLPSIWCQVLPPSHMRSNNVASSCPNGFSLWLRFLGAAEWWWRWVGQGGQLVIFIAQLIRHCATSYSISFLL